MKPRNVFKMFARKHKDLWRSLAQTSKLTRMWGLWIGILLIISSFMIKPEYLAIPFLSNLSTNYKYIWTLIKLICNWQLKEPRLFYKWIKLASKFVINEWMKRYTHICSMQIKGYLLEVLFEFVLNSGYFLWRCSSI